MLSAFPPGGLTLQMSGTHTDRDSQPRPARQREPCLWRETALMLALLCRALTPALGLSATMNNWAAVRYRLAEPPRKRVSQRMHAYTILS